MKKTKITTNRFGLPIVKDARKMLLTFTLVVVGLIIFRSDSLWQAWEYFLGMLQFGTLRASYRFFVQSDVWTSSLFSILMLVVEWFQRDKSHGLEVSNIKYSWLRYVVYYILIVLILNNFGEEKAFIYFQF